MNQREEIRIAIFASGNGSNAENIVRYFADNKRIKFTRIFCNNAEAFVRERAKNLEIPELLFTAKQFRETSIVLKQLLDDNTDFIILAGFLLRIPTEITQSFFGRIVNIHPALLPKFGGKGMYGMRVHQAVKEAGETESGITIHQVNENYDEGAIIFQAKVDIAPDDSPEDIANKVHHLEYEYFPQVIWQYIQSAQY
ncbi:MAG: phosphoribosylglycinamide formyltransferase [Bacteroidales bacterium]|nr:phosphoribosylglycinamide formyltransferase [Bacteroidales bacterium]